MSPEELTALRTQAKALLAEGPQYQDALYSAARAKQLVRKLLAALDTPCEGPGWQLLTLDEIDVACGWFEILTDPSLRARGFTPEPEDIALHARLGRALAACPIHERTCR